jgi:hypothetical protein
MAARLEVIATRLSLADLEWAVMTRLCELVMAMMLNLTGFKQAEVRFLELEMWATETRLNLSDFEWVVVARLRSDGLEQMVILAVFKQAVAVSLGELVMVVTLKSDSLGQEVARLYQFVMVAVLNLGSLEQEMVRLRSDGFEWAVAGHHGLCKLVAKLNLDDLERAVAGLC